VVVLLLAVPLWRGANMPNWNGLGYQQLAQTRLSQKADRSQQGWMKFVDTMNQYFQTQGAQQYQTGRDAMQQKYSLESLAAEYGYGQQQAVTRQGYDVENAKTARDFSATEDAKYRMPVGTQISESAKDRAMQGQGKTPDAVDVVTNYISSLIGAGKIPKDATGGPDFGALMNNKELLAEVTRRFDSYLKYSAYTGDPAMAKQWLSEYLSMGSTPGVPQNDPSKPTSADTTDFANKVMVTGAVANALLPTLMSILSPVVMGLTSPVGVAATIIAILNREKLSDKVPAVRQWLNDKFNGLGDKIFNQTSVPPGAPKFGAGTQTQTTPAYPQGRGTKP
jgi:hypothetical protein